MDSRVSLARIKIVKALSEETPCFTADVLLDGRVVGSAQNPGHGGPNEYRWADREAGAEVVSIAQARPAEFGYEKLDQLVADLMDEAEEMKALKRWCKAKIVYRYEDTPRGEWLTLPGRLTPEARARLVAAANARGRRPIAEFANDRFPATPRVQP